MEWKFTVASDGANILVFEADKVRVRREAANFVTFERLADDDRGPVALAHTVNLAAGEVLLGTSAEGHRMSIDAHGVSLWLTAGSGGRLELDVEEPEPT